MDNFGTIFSDKVGMGTESTNIRGRRELESSNGNPILYKRSSNFLYNLSTLYKKMAGFKITWLLFNLLGWPTAIITLFSAIFGDVVLQQIEEPYKSIIIIFGIFFLLMKILIAYENWQEKHLMNRERKMKLDNHGKPKATQH